MSSKEDKKMTNLKERKIDKLNKYIYYIYILFYNVKIRKVSK
jgi:hypothetical protein